MRCCKTFFLEVTSKSFVPLLIFLAKNIKFYNSVGISQNMSCLIIFYDYFLALLFPKLPRRFENDYLMYQLLIFYVIFNFFIPRHYNILFDKNIIIIIGFISHFSVRQSQSICMPLLHCN